VDKVESAKYSNLDGIEKNKLMIRNRCLNIASRDGWTVIEFEKFIKLATSRDIEYFLEAACSTFGVETIMKKNRVKSHAVERKQYSIELHGVLKEPGAQNLFHLNTPRLTAQMGNSL
jgi:hypothetical protein